MASLRFPDPLCRFHRFPGIDSGTLCRQASPAPGPVERLSLWPDLYDPRFFPAALGLSDAITAADRAEFAVIGKMGALDRHGRPYHTVNSYLSDRTCYFGSPFAYAAFAAESDAELGRTRWIGKRGIRTLGSMLEFGKHIERQRIFYRWVRKAYKNKYGHDKNVPELIRRGMSDELAKKIAEVRGSIRVRRAHEQHFKTGGFNPRPVKLCGCYRLGTLSKHATGMAVDIDDTANAQFKAEDWQSIEEFVGRRVMRFGRWKSESDAEALWTDIREVNDLFMKRVASEVRRIERERNERKVEVATAQGAAMAADPSWVAPPLHAVLGERFQALSPWAHRGFFHLPLELVLELHFRGFVWGATFHDNVDLHHFELEE
ncbi:MAG: hypothetical protein LAQ30_07750 [Acidobacteriia bacterium]|nr:hypothetical protein [Terriglobia bacterium]